MYATSESDPRIVLTSAEAKALLAFCGKPNPDKEKKFADEPFIWFCVENGILRARASCGWGTVECIGTADPAAIKGQWCARSQFLKSMCIRGCHEMTIELSPCDSEHSHRGDITYGIVRTKKGKQLNCCVAPEGQTWGLDPEELHLPQNVIVPNTERPAGIVTFSPATHKASGLIAAAAGVQNCTLYLPKSKFDPLVITAKRSDSMESGEWRAEFRCPLVDDPEDREPLSEPADIELRDTDHHELAFGRLERLG